MNGIVAVTDSGWYEFLSQRSLPEVNFWKPSDTRRPHIPEFTPFFFQLKKKYRAIVGFAYFARWSHLPLWLAWDAFAEGNGCDSLSGLIDSVTRLRHESTAGPEAANSEIGCLLLTEPTFFSRDQWVDAPSDWSDQIVTSRKYDLEVGEGRRVWEACQRRVAKDTGASARPARTWERSPDRWGEPQLVTPRLGQGTFRVGVLDAYGRSCAITEEHSLPVLEAAHIRSYANNGPHDVSNGILMRADLHRLFDTGYITVAPDFRLEVSGRLKADFSNGKTYYPLAGNRIRLPKDRSETPNAAYLEWHRENVYRG